MILGLKDRLAPDGDLSGSRGHRDGLLKGVVTPPRRPSSLEAARGAVGTSPFSGGNAKSSRPRLLPHHSSQEMWNQRPLSHVGLRRSGAEKPQEGSSGQNVTFQRRIKMSSLNDGWRGHHHEEKELEFLALRSQKAVLPGCESPPQRDAGLSGSRKISTPCNFLHWCLFFIGEYRPACLPFLQPLPSGRQSQEASHLPSVL